MCRELGAQVMQLLAPCVVRRCAGSQQLERRGSAAEGRCECRGRGWSAVYWTLYSQRAVVVERGVQLMQLHSTSPCATPANSISRVLAEISHVSRHRRRLGLAHGVRRGAPGLHSGALRRLQRKRNWNIWPVRHPKITCMTAFSNLRQPSQPARRGLALRKYHLPVFLPPVSATTCTL